ncbi:MAG: transposase [Planctomycetaceae bacterium]|nr:transposase [Planctomycetaceae bacterium]
MHQLAARPSQIAALEDRAWRRVNSLSLKRFMGHDPFDKTPDHSSLSRARGRLPLEVFAALQNFLLEVLQHQKLLDHTLDCLDATTLKANVAMSSIVRKDIYGNQYTASLQLHANH